MTAISTAHDQDRRESPAPAREPSASYQFALAAAELAANTRCTEVAVLDLRGRSPVTEFFVIATGTSAVQIRTVADELADLGARSSFRAWHTSGYEGARWIVVDCVNVVIHVFDAVSREFYDLELFWGDAPRLDWRKELGLPPDTAEALRARTPADVPLADRFAEATGQDEAAAAEEDARLEGRDLESEEGDADVDEDAETEAPVVVELPDLSTGSNSVEFVEIDPPANRRQRGKAVFPTPLKERDDDEPEQLGAKPVERVSRDEDEQEQASEAAADRDVEAVSAEDLPADQLEDKPMGGVSASMSSTLIEEDNEEQQRAARELDDVEHDHRDETPPAQEAVAENVRVRKRDADTGAVELNTEEPGQRPRGRKVRSRADLAAPVAAAPGPVDTKKAKAGVAPGAGRKVTKKAPARKAAARNRSAKKKSPAKKGTKAAKPASKKPAAKRKVKKR